MFYICEGKGFQMTFENGVTLSVQFGPANYCENYGVNDFQAPRKTDRWKSKDAEVAILLPDGEFYQIQEHDQVTGRQTVEDVCKWIELARNLVTV
jgi:hypothetical protein